MPALMVCSLGDAGQSAARALRAPVVQSLGTATSPLHDLVRQATLTPLSHYTQCWRFQSAERSISLAPDFVRRCPAVDPDDHHLFVSPGCATQNLVHAALTTGLHADPRFDPCGDGVIAANPGPTQKQISPLFQAGLA